MFYKTKIKVRKMIVLKNKLLKWQFNIKCSLIKEQLFSALSKQNYKLEIFLRLSELKSKLRNIKNKMTLMMMNMILEEVNKNVL